MKFLCAVLFSLVLARAEADSENPCEGLDLVFVNDPSSCGAYFSCVSGRAFQLTCNNGRWFYYRPEVGCHLPNSVPCQICPATGISRVPVPQSCTEYTLCINGTPIESECPERTRFDRTTGQCNKAELVECEYSRCPADSRGFQPDPDSCNQYLLCFDGDIVQERECPGDLLFDAELGSCALPDNVDCGDRPRPTRN
jgi:hypothetical protein